MGNKYRVVEAGTSTLVKNKAGTPVDGGGFGSRDHCIAQVHAINMAQRRRNRA
jgi:hypothetical protein